MPSTSRTPEPGGSHPVGWLIAGDEGPRVGVEDWLLKAADDADRARREWDSEGLTLLRCGGEFGVVRINAALVHAAAGTDDLRRVDQYLSRVLLGGPIFMDRNCQRYFALVHVHTGRRPEWRLPRNDAEVLPSGAFVGVPAVSSTAPDGRLYWCTQVSRPGFLVTADAVAQLMRIGRDRLASERNGG
jgi:hypothetical protein